MTDARSNPAARVPVPRSVRLGSFLLAALLTALIGWLLGFVLHDIGDLEGPDYRAVVDEYVEPGLREQSRTLEDRITAIEARIERQQELQTDLSRSMDNARETMQQMMSLQRLALEQSAPPTETEKEALATAQQLFLKAQDRFEVANAEIAASNETKHQVRQELRALEATIAEQAAPARAEYQTRHDAHQFRVASYKLAFIVPVFLLAAALFARHRASAYRSILIALLLASFWTLGAVMFDYFPLEFFKYIAIVTAIAIVLAFLIWLLTKVVRPSRRLLLDRYREAYRAHVCPVCAYPIARGPLRFATWSRKGPRVPELATSTGEQPALETPYGCPSCGTNLFATCRVCGSPRHTLLPFCEHCGDELVEAPSA